LLVEDHEPTRLALSHLLTRRLYEVIVAASLAEARILAGAQSFDLLISDIGLPDGNGCDLMIELNKDGLVRGIALTGYGMEEDLKRSQNAGFIAHLTKPVRIESLEAALHKATRSNG
jgi:CheY-like chemotaxis protein